MKKNKDKLNVDVKVGILHTIANAIYSTPAGKIREAVANAIDKEANWMIIIADQTTKSLFLFDNGTGISESRFHEIFKSIGYGFLRDEPTTSLSYFGLGLMSIFRLGRKVKLFTQPRGEHQLYKLDVDSDAIFKEENEKKSISSLTDFIDLNKTDESTRSAASVTLLNRSLEEVRFKNNLTSFTEIIIEGIKEEDFNAICDYSFKEELRKLLPLKPEKDDPFLKRLTGEKVKEIRKIMRDKEFFKTMDIYFGIQEEDTLEQLWKYFPSFRSDMTFPDDNIYVGQSVNKDFAYYIIHSVAVDLYRSKEQEDDNEKSENGFWIRNQNFLVKHADFLEKSGLGRKVKTIDKPLKGWVFGEIFHKDMNQFLAVSRTDFLFEKKAFKKFQEEIREIVNPLNKELRDIYKKKKKIIDELVEPFSKLSTKDGPIARAEDRLREMVGPRLGSKKLTKYLFERLKKIRKEKIEDGRLRIDKILRQKKAIIIGEDEDALVKINPILKGKGDDYDVVWDAKNKKVIVSISPDLFEPKQVTFLEKEFTIYFVAARKEDPGASFDVDNMNIYINPFNEEFSQYSVSIFDVYISLQIAHALSNNKDEMVKNTLILLGTISEVATKYITPLGDNLRRTVQLSGVRV